MIAFILGAILGGTLGALAMALCVASSRLPTLEISEKEIADEKPM